MNTTIMADLSSFDEATNPLAPLFAQLRNLYAGTFMTVAGVTLFAYDWLITFDEEWQYIWWGGRFTSVKLLYILNRILTPAILAVDLYDKGGLSTGMTQQMPVDVAIRWLGDPYFLRLDTLSVDATRFWIGWSAADYHDHLGIVTLRVWTVYGRSRRLLAVFLVAFLAYFATTAYIWAISAAVISKTIFPSPVIVHICYTVIPDYMWWLWVPSIIYECVIFFATLWKAWEHHRVNLNTPILSVLYRDGFIYFFVICMLSLANMFSWLWAPHSLAILFKYFSLAAVNVVAFRLVLDLRSVGQATLSTDAPVTGESHYIQKREQNPVSVSFGDVEMSPQGGHAGLDRNRSARSVYGRGFLASAIPEGRSVFIPDEPALEDGGWELVQPPSHSRQGSQTTHARTQHVQRPPAGSYKLLPERQAQLPISPISPNETDRFIATSPTRSIGIRAMSPVSPRSPTGSTRIPPELIAAIDFGPLESSVIRSGPVPPRRVPVPLALADSTARAKRHPYGLAPPLESPRSPATPGTPSFGRVSQDSPASPTHLPVHSTSFLPSVSGSLRSYDPEAADALESQAGAPDRPFTHMLEHLRAQGHRDSAGSASVYSQQAEWAGARSMRGSGLGASTISHSHTFGHSHEHRDAVWSEEDSQKPIARQR
ncbi:hypothetical protein BKA62DRAFT_171912 [Auriculariales sp. MPI-PUGE-AT-0066]|nr:hypothetical protein BKA62DRAFT_171912 [Auriculariales sp. MPI-PUGE-AT-0066]